MRLPGQPGAWPTMEASLTVLGRTMTNGLGHYFRVAPVAVQGVAQFKSRERVALLSCYAGGVRLAHRHVSVWPIHLFVAQAVEAAVPGHRDNWLLTSWRNRAFQ
jgi:hypothetical protein